MGRRRGRRAGGARAAGRNRAPAGARLADVPPARAAAAAVPAAAPAAAGRDPLLRLSGLEDGRLPGERARPGTRLGTGRRRLTVRVRLHAVAQRARGRPPAVPRPHGVHALLVRALLQGVADADAGGIPDLRGAPDPAPDL